MREPAIAAKGDALFTRGRPQKALAAGPELGYLLNQSVDN